MSAGDASFANSPGSASRTGWTTLGALPLVSSRGVERWATYRAIYLTNPWAYVPIQMLARSVGRLPIHTYALDAQANKQRVRYDVATPGPPSAAQRLDKLLQRPGGRMSRNALFAGTMIDRLVYGNALWRLGDIQFGLPSSITRIRWRDMLRVTPAADGSALGYVYRPWNGVNYGPVETIDPTEVVHFGLGSDPEGVYGISPLEACRHTIALHEALVRHLIAYFQNSARPSGVFKVDELTDEVIEQTRRMLVALHTTPENAGKILATSGEWQEIGHSPDHSSIVELIRLSREELLAIYGVPPPVAGVLEQAIKSNVKELREQYGREAVGPWASDFESELMAQLVLPQPAWAGLFSEFQMAEMLRPDLEARALVYQRMQAYYTIDEIRGFENKPPLNLPGVSDVPLIPKGVAPGGVDPGSQPRDRAAEPTLDD